MLGHPYVALRRAADAVAVARTLDQPASLALILGAAAIFHQMRGDPKSARDLASAGLTIANEHHIASQQMVCHFMHGWAVGRTGLRAEGLAEMQQTQAAMEAAGMALWGPHFCGMIAEVCDEADRVETGLAAANEGLAIADATGQAYYVAELNRLRGELLLLEHGESAAAEAEVCFRRALEIARRQEARAWELRAAMSLARLAQRQCKGTETRPRLAEIYAAFTEGFDTPDLRNARALLDALA
jgi:predicted ATPase